MICFTPTLHQYYLKNNLADHMLFFQIIGRYPDPVELRISGLADRAYVYIDHRLVQKFSPDAWLYFFHRRRCRLFCIPPQLLPIFLPPKEQTFLQPQTVPTFYFHPRQCQLILSSTTINANFSTSTADATEPSFLPPPAVPILLPPTAIIANFSSSSADGANFFFYRRRC